VNTVFVHGGVSGRAKPQLPSLAHSLPAALEAPRAVDAVELAVIALEDDPALNAGFGSVLAEDGSFELDAGLVDGSTGRCGAVAGVTVRHPISLARRVLEDTPHVLMIPPGAAALGAGLEELSDTSDEQRRRWEAARSAGTLGGSGYAPPEHVDTVGAVALDTSGGLAAGSSTGGVFGQLPGRVGDSPLFGAGFYASSAAAVVGTGVGELFVETLACFRTAALIESGVDVQDACERIIEYIGGRRRTAAGLLAVDRSGRWGAAFRGGSWAVEGPEGPIDAVQLD
jgi:L-asparaginase / beta-aspartyl-peptidase